jgi:hypothetical protein
MSVRIQLDDPHAFYTNLDFISGRVILSLTSDENVSAITVKLEGESKTILMRPMGPSPNQDVYSRRDRRQGLAVENHKILYKVQQVFPTPKLADGSGLGMAGYTLRVGQHEYPFRFKIPFNNGCSDPHSQQMGPGSGFGGLGLGGLQQLQYRHVKRTLPPSLTGFQGEAEIRYYIKVTVQRPSLFKENRRNAIGFRFLPIEPPRPPKTSNEVYARRPYAFTAGLAPYAKKSSFFTKKPTKLSDTAPKGEIDARLPSPAILTCNEPLPLRIIARKLNESPETLFLMTLQVHLFGLTEVRAQDVARTETSTWVLMSLSGLRIPILTGNDPLRHEAVIDQNLWDRIPLPNTVAPSFHICNLTRKYELEVRVGLGYGVIGEIQVPISPLHFSKSPMKLTPNLQPQTITLPLRFQVEIYSGISPPTALLDAMASRPTQPVPVQPAAPTTYDPAYPPQLGVPGGPGQDDAPPSYEDAMADELAPADGPRPAYSGVTDVNAIGIDEKGGSARQGDAKGGSESMGGRSTTV